MPNRTGIVIHTKTTDIEFRTTTAWSPDRVFKAVWASVQTALKTNQLGGWWLGNEIATDLMRSSFVEGIGISNRIVPTIHIYPEFNHIECRGPQTQLVKRLFFDAPNSEVEKAADQFALNGLAER